MAMTRRGIEKALAKLEDVAVAKARSVRPAPFDEADRLAWFTQAGEEKLFAREPDFTAALALLRDELAEARESTDPPFDPPADFQPDQRYLHIRRETWRHEHHFPNVCAALDWLFEHHAERGSHTQHRYRTVALGHHAGGVARYPVDERHHVRAQQERDRLAEWRQGR